LKQSRLRLRNVEDAVDQLWTLLEQFDEAFFNGTRVVIEVPVPAADEAFRVKFRVNRVADWASLQVVNSQFPVIL
jgi:hypothetical protein